MVDAEGNYYLDISKFVGLVTIFQNISQISIYEIIKKNSIEFNCQNLKEFLLFIRQVNL